eukprot:CAMPEP_0195052334 /NCGR_PEP_ID=MMETSP0448-20130528/1680_1 /TAXON_ID=66468 /ORGANISM="Heterocapsa triquestra, Strain CCMP 448" /LENGTH=534 /DNA_ID=CAMNT_0040081455 /DNA_START=67 /DNA_END=1671 /DNA_ORIENTATION=+
MVGGAVSVAHEAMDESEMMGLLMRAGFKDDGTIKDVIPGNGGFGTVVMVALFASLGGMLFGLDVGYIAGVKSMVSFENDVLGGRKITDSEDSWITMIFGVGAAVAAFPPIINWVVDTLGRKGSVIAGGIVFCVGALMQGLAMEMMVMMIGRFIAGMSVGILSANVPVYQSEIAPPSHRGMLVAVYQLAVTVGIMVAFLMALLLENVEKPIGGWRWVILGQLIPGGFLAIGGIIMPRSPRWLVSKKRYKDALNTLIAVRREEEDVRIELAQILREREHERASGKPRWSEFFSGDMLKLLMIGVSLQMIQQMCGLNAFMYDGPRIFEIIFKSSHAGRLFTAVSGVVNILSTFPAIFLVDKKGRCALLMWSAAGMAICSAVLAFVGDMCYPMGEANAAVDQEDACGPWAKWVATGSICLFIFNFGYGWGPVVWTYCAEMFPMKYRTKAVGATTDANWIGNIFIAMLPPIMLAHMGFKTFYAFTVVNCFGFLFGRYLPETKDKSLEEVNVMFERWFAGKSKDDDSSEYTDANSSEESD